MPGSVEPLLKDAQLKAATFAASLAFVAAITSVTIWALTGPAMDFSDTWLLLINGW